MEADPAPFDWSDAASKAVELVARDDLTDKRIAADLGVGTTTLYRWKRHPEFMARVDVYRAEMWEAVRRHGLAILENRVRAKDERWRRLCALIETRARQLAEIPGGDTGALVRRVKGIGSGDNFREVDEYEFDASVFAELRSLEREAAQDLGQWTEKRQVSGEGGGPVKLALGLETLPDDELATLQRILEKLADDGPEGSPPGDPGGTLLPLPG
jgi:hypothetical protein